MWPQRSLSLLTPYALFGWPLLLVLLGACSHMNRWTIYNLTYKSRPVLSDTLPANTDTFFTHETEFVFDFEKDMDHRAVKTDKIEKASLYEIQIAIKLDSPVNTFNFMRTLRVYIEGEGFPRRLLTEFERVPISENFLILSLDEKDGILSLLNKNKFNVIMEFSTSEELQDEVHFEIDTRFEIDAEQFFI